MGHSVSGETPCRLEGQ